MKRNGFTLIELLIVIALIGVLTAIAVPRFGSEKRTGEVNACKANLQSIEMALESYYSENGAYPTSGDLTTLVSGGYLKVEPRCEGGAGGSYIWNADPVSAIDFGYVDSTRTAGTYRGGRAFCTLHGIVDPAYPADWKPDAVMPESGGEGGGGGGGGA